MDKIRISQIAKEIGKTSKEILQKAQELGFEVKTASSAVTTEQAEELYNYVLSGKSVEIKTSKEETKKSTKTEKTTKTKKEESKLKKTKEDEIDKKTRTKTSTKDSKKESPKQDLPITPQENSTIKRTGLRIVKKRDLKTEEIPQTPIEEKKEPSKTLQDLLGNFDNDSFAKKDKKKKKEKSNLQHTKKPNQQKIDLLDNREFQSSDDEEEEGIILFDLSVQDEVNLDEEENEKRATTERIKIQRHNPFMEQGSTRRSSRKKAPKPQKTQETIQGIVNIPEEIRAYEFAEKIGRSTGDVIKVLFSLGMMVTKNDFLEKDAIEILAEEFGIQIEITNNADELDYTQLHESNENEKDLVERAPVVTIMGHVDHGKTSLLDYIRNTKIASAEAGGITQHIGAYTITKNGKQITFIDTPGHEAFSEMRARGASVTDIAIIVIAADDGIKPQTIEALNHAKAANAPIIIAVNKIDKPEANTDKVKAEAAELGFTPLEWGGEYEFVHISAKTGEGIDDLLETILLQAEILELKANPNKPARAVVIESSLEKGKGPDPH